MTKFTVAKYLNRMSKKSKRNTNKSEKSQKIIHKNSNTAVRISNNVYRKESKKNFIGLKDSNRIFFLMWKKG